MSPALLGAGIGAGFGLLSFVVLIWVAGTLDETMTNTEQKRAATLMLIVAFANLVMFSILGYWVGPLLISDWRVE